MLFRSHFRAFVNCPFTVDNSVNIFVTEKRSVRSILSLNYIRQYYLRYRVKNDKVRSYVESIADLILIDISRVLYI